MTKIARLPVANSKGVEKITRPAASVAISAKICTPVGITTAWLAAEKNARLIFGRPVVNMWCTQRPKLRNAVPTAARTI